MNHLELFNQYRELLFSMAYRMTGSVMDTEDLVQEAFIKWQKVDLSEVKSYKSFLSTIIIRLCIDYLRSARVQREKYIGPWLPEPLITEEIYTPGSQLEINDSLSIAFMVMLEKLSPVERAVFLLHDVFNYTYSEISEIIDKSEENCRQIMHRANEHLKSKRQRFHPTPNQQEKLLTQFINACSKGDLNGLLSILTEDIVLYSDGGGKVTAAKLPIFTSEKVSRFIAAISLKVPPNFSLKPYQLNGQPGFIGYVDYEPYNVFIFDFNAEKIENIYIVINPDKLAKLPKLAIT